MLSFFPTASAQTTEPPPPPRPYRGLFGGGADVTQPGLRLVLSGAGGHDSNLLATQQGGAGSTSALLQRGFSGQFGEGSSTLTYLRQRGDTSFTVGGSSTGRLYPQLDRPTTQSHFATAQLDFRIGRRWAVSLGQSAHYASFYHLEAVPTGVGSFAQPPSLAPPVAVSPDAGVGSNGTHGYDSNVNLTQFFGPRNTVAYHYMRRKSDTGFANRRLNSWGAGALYQRGMTRYSALRVGYSYVEGRYQGAPVATRTPLHDVDTGIDYARPLSFSRRTTVGFSGGMLMFNRDNAMLYRFQGASNIAHEFGRTWNLDLAYNRGAQLVDVLDAPVFSDTVTGHLGGFLGGGRLELSIDGDYSNGQLSYSANRNDMVSYSGSGRLEYALNDRWMMYGAYTYYSYDFGANVTLPAELLPAVARHSARVGFSVWFPLTTQRGSRGTR